MKKLCIYLIMFAFFISSLAAGSFEMKIDMNSRELKVPVTAGSNRDGKKVSINAEMDIQKLEAQKDPARIAWLKEAIIACEKAAKMNKNELVEFVSKTENARMLWKDVKFVQKKAGENQEELKAAAARSLADFKFWLKILTSGKVELDKMRKQKENEAAAEILKLSNSINDIQQKINDGNKLPWYRKWVFVLTTRRSLETAEYALNTTLQLLSGANGRMLLKIELDKYDPVFVRMSVDDYRFAK